MVSGLLQILLFSSCIIQTPGFYTNHYVVSQTRCSLLCYTTPKCYTFLYGAAKSAGNCILMSSSGERSQIIFDHHYALVRYNSKKIIYQLVEKAAVEEEAFNAGFNFWIVIKGIKTFLAGVFKTTHFNDAMQQCFLRGGILPMERTDEFIEGMSNLSNDSVTPRFTSLVRGVTEANGVRHLVWNMGLKEWGEDENATNHPIFGDWPKSNFDSYLFLIDPTNHKYIPSSVNHYADFHFCQYVGTNLAKGKSVTCSSVFQSYHCSYAVDGLLGENIWHADHDKIYQPDWISVDLKAKYRVKFVLWIGRQDGYAERNKDVQVWVGDHFLANHSLWRSGNFPSMRLCGMHPYTAHKNILCGITCKEVLVGQYVTLVNYDWQNGYNAMHMGELGIFGSPH